MSDMLPGNKPKLMREDAERYISAFSGIENYKVKLLGIRSYFKTTMGDPTKNDVGIYDDAMFIAAPDKLFLSYNANTDPSRVFPGVAILKAGGPYLYKVGMHGISGPHPYMALRQHGRVTVLRSGIEHTDTAVNPFYIDIHKGGYNTTSSLGCQTIHPDQWADFFTNVQRLMAQYKQTEIPYCLVEY
jgi:hypothetical protein